MLIRFEGATLVFADHIRQTPLIVDTRRGRIVEAKPYQKITRIDAAGLALFPALINAHDHLEFNHYPRTKWRPRYDNASQWAHDMQPHLEQSPFAELRRLPLHTRCWHGALKNLFSGVGLVVHHNAPHRMLFRRNFPVQVYRPYAWAHALYSETPRSIQKAYRKRGLFFIHLAEGTDQAALAELDQLAEFGCLGEKTILIHVVGLRDAVQSRAIQDSGGLVWCPSSNHFLLGQTADVMPWHQAGKLLLGSDSLLTADGDLLDELRSAKANSPLSAQQLFRLVTQDAARILNLVDWGSLATGNVASLFALRLTSSSDPYQALLQATPTDVVWSMQRGRFLFRRDVRQTNALWQGHPLWLAKSIRQGIQRLSVPYPSLSLANRR